ncbi:hypothetical protein [Nocardioides ferulae]|uniref:hypothetical protein n=1 Tax=Nocardioides ferulae TaxID=2340821 RepID=UPI000EAF3E5F|nr:hypothetical protein [Nocardioides ferulae]
MIGRVIASLAMACAGLSATASPAQAACTWQNQVVFQNGVAHIESVYVCSGSSAGGSGDGDDGAVTAGQVMVTDSGLDPVCVRTALSTGVAPEEFCEGDGVFGTGAEPPPTVTPGMVATAFQELPLPASELVVQPPDGRTLVNFATNFYTENGPFTETVTLLGQRVDLRIWPAEFTWVFGDGTSHATAEPGAPYPALEVTHEYLRKGRVSPRVDTTYAAEFRVNGGAWAPVAGTVTIPGEPVGLEVETATPVLVAYE